MNEFSEGSDLITLKEAKVILAKIFLGIIVLVFIVGAIGVGYKYVFAPIDKKIERKVAVESHQYQESAQNALVQLAEQYRRLEVDVAKNINNQVVVDALNSQMSAIKSQMRLKVKNVPGDMVPIGVRSIINN
jgi:hypothetical protein